MEHYSVLVCARALSSCGAVKQRQNSQGGREGAFGPWFRKCATTWEWPTGTPKYVRRLTRS